MKRKFLTNLALIFILNLVIKTFWMFGIDRTVQNRVGAEEYGLYFSLLSLSILLNIILDAGIINFNNRSVARDFSNLSPNFSRILPLKFFLAVIYSLVVILTGLIAGYSARQFHLLWFLIINQFLLSFILYLRSNFSGLHLFTTDSFFSVLDRFFVILICGVLLWSDILKTEFRIEWFVYSQSLAYFLSAVIILFIVLTKTGKVRLRFPIQYGLSILKESYPFAILILLMAFFNRFDAILLERLLEDGKVQAGIYAQSYRILDAANMYAVLIAGMLLPIFSRMIKMNDSIGEMIRLSFSIVAIPAFTLASISFFYNREIIGLLYNEHIEISSGIYRILISGFIFISTSYIFGTLMTANGNLKQINILAAVTVILNISLNLILIPRYKATGAATSALVSQGFYAVSQVISSIFLVKYKTDSSFVGRFLLYVVGIVLSSLVIHRFVETWFHGILLIISVSLLLVWVLGILTPKSLYNMIKYDT